LIRSGPGGPKRRPRLSDSRLNLALWAAVIVLVAAFAAILVIR
jgi:hypothetical protein